METCIWLRENVYKYDDDDLKLIIRRGSVHKMKLKEKSFDLLIFLDLIGVIVCLLETTIACNISTNTLMIQWLLIDVYCFLRAVNIFNNILHPHIVFMGMINLFLCGRIFLDFIYDIPFYYTTYFTKYPFDTVVRNDTLLMLSLALITANLGAVMGWYLWPESKTTLSTNKKGLFWSKIIMTILFIPVIIFYYQKYELVSEFGYLILFAGQGNAGSVNVLKESPLIHFTVIWMLAFYIFLGSHPEKRDFIIYSVLYFCIAIFSMMSGQRSEFGMYFIVYVVYYTTYIKKISINTILILLTSTIFAFSIVATLRSSDNYELNNFNAEDMLQIFFTQQGVSINVLGYADQYKETGEISDVFYPLDGYIKQKLDPDFRKQDEYYADKIALQAQPNLYHAGRGVGSSYIAELYSAFGFIGVFLGGLILSLLNLFLYNSKLVRNSLFGCFILCIFWKNLAIMPRGAYLNFVLEFLKFGLPLYVLIKLFEYKKCNNIGR